MTTTYDPTHPAFLDEADVRGELSRVFEICNGCRACVDLCGVFPKLFEMIGRHADQDPGRLTPAQQDRVVDLCTQCKSCVAGCPYAPPLHEAAVDVPRLVLRAEAMQRDVGIPSIRERARTYVAGRIDRVGPVASSAAWIVNRVTGARPPFVRHRFSKWFAERPGRATTAVPMDDPARVTIFPTCVVEYRRPDVGKDLVAGLEAIGVDCTLSDAGCCGASSLDAGDMARFTQLATVNVGRFAAAVRRGTDIVVAERRCRDALTFDYPAYVGGPDADLVASHTFDGAEFLAARGGDGVEPAER